MLIVDGGNLLVELDKFEGVAIDGNGELDESGEVLEVG